jgi:hypothetical protein
LDSDKYVEENNKLLWMQISKLSLKPHVIEDFNNILDNLGVSYYGHIESFTSTMSQRLFLFSVPFKKRTKKLYHVQAAKDKEHLDKLITARTDKDIGLALGFPKEAIAAYNEVVAGERRDGQYAEVSLAKAKQAGLQLPTWLAYINHVPEKLDLMNSDVSETSRALGNKYQTFVRSTNDLARRVEEQFLARKLPDAWEKTSNQSYETRYNP